MHVYMHTYIHTYVHISQTKMRVCYYVHDDVSYSNYAPPTLVGEKGENGGKKNVHPVS